jgi:putative transposase
MEYDGEYPESKEGKIIGIDLGIKDFAITYDGEGEPL